jgi:hypothetical protein
MPDRTAEDDPASASARRLGKRLAILLVIGVAVAFIGSSAEQIVLAVFGFGVRPLPPAPPGSSARTCAEGVRILSEGLERASSNGEPPSSAWDATNPVYQACAASPEGLDAWAALLRLRMTAEQVPRTGPQELDHLRRDLYAHLPADLR